MNVLLFSMLATFAMVALGVFHVVVGNPPWEVAVTFFSAGSCATTTVNAGLSLLQWRRR